MVGHRLDLEAVGKAVGSKGFVCGGCHVDGFRLQLFLIFSALTDGTGGIIGIDSI